MNNLNQMNHYHEAISLTLFKFIMSRHAATSRGGIVLQLSIPR